MSFHVLENGDIRADFTDPDVESLTLALADVPEAVRLAAVTEGLISRARGYASKLTDAERTPAALADAVKSAFANLIAGVWKAPRATAAAEFSIEVEAAHLFRKMKAETKGEAFTDTLETVDALWNSLTDEQKKQVKDLPRYKAAYAQIKAARQADRAAKLLRKAEADEADSPV